jgi:hypothetical protein
MLRLTVRGSDIRSDQTTPSETLTSSSSLLSLSLMPALDRIADSSQTAHQLRKVPNPEIPIGGCDLIDTLQFAKSLLLEVSIVRCLQMRLLFGANRTATASVCVWLRAMGSSQSQATDLEQLLNDGRVPALSFALIQAKLSRRKLSASATRRSVNIAVPALFAEVFAVASRFAHYLQGYEPRQILIPGVLELQIWRIQCEREGPIVSREALPPTSQAPAPRRNWRPPRRPC